MRECKKHGRILYGLGCINCEKREAAADKIRKQPFYDRKQCGYSLFDIVASCAARRMLNSFKSTKYTWQGPLQRIRHQPFFGVDSSLPTTIKFRRPVNAVIADVVQDSIRYGMGMSHVDPRDVWKVEQPIYTLDDICWRSYA